MDILIYFVMHIPYILLRTLESERMVFYKTLNNQDWLIPPRIEDIIENDHLCYIVALVVDDMDFSDIEKEIDGPGHPSYPPRIMIKIILMGTIDGILSSRKLQKNAKQDVVYMYLAEKMRPDFRTISDFRKNNPELIEACFKKVVAFARDLGMVRLGHISIDGTKIKANASKSKTFTKEELEFLDEFIKKEIQQGILEDESEDEEYGRNNTGYELPGHVRSIENIKQCLKKKLEEFKINEKSRRRVMKKAEEYLDGDISKQQKLKKQIENGLEILETSECRLLNFTDPDSRLMKNKQGVFDQEYNGQIAVDSEEKIIIAADVCQSAVDTNELIPMIENTEAVVGKLPEGTEVSADNGFFSGENVHQLEERKIDGYIPNSEQAQKMNGKALKQNRFGKESFEYDAQNDWYICPNGKLLSFYYKYDDKQLKRTIRGYRCYDCDDCPYKTDCITEEGKNFKRIHSDNYEGCRRRMKQKMDTELGRTKYKNRGKNVEHPFGDIKGNMKLRSFLTCGKTGVKTEFKLACIAHNIKRIGTFIRKEYTNIKQYIQSVKSYGIKCRMCLTS